jgi:ribosomal protein L24
MIPVNAWSHSYSDIVKVVEGLDTGADGSIEVVSPEEMVRRVRRNVKHDEEEETEEEADEVVDEVVATEESTTIYI